MENNYLSKKLKSKQVDTNDILGGTNYVALVTGIICIIGLLLPTEGEQSHRVPDYLHLSMNFKLIFSFVLGKHEYVYLCMCICVRTCVYITILHLFHYRYGCKYCFRAIKSLAFYIKIFIYSIKKSLDKRSIQDFFILDLLSYRIYPILVYKLYLYQPKYDIFIIIIIIL